MKFATFEQEDLIELKGRITVIHRNALVVFAAGFVVCASILSQEPDTALDSPQIIVNPGPEYAAETRPFQGIPGIERAANGR